MLFCVEVGRSVALYDDDGGMIFLLGFRFRGKIDVQVMGSKC